MSFQSSDFLPVHRNGETYKATTNELKEYLETDFVKKTGDEMTGDLTISNTTADNSKLILGSTWTAGIWHKDIEKISWYGDYGYFEGIWEFTDITGDASFFVLYPDKTPAESAAEYMGAITENNHITNKKYVDDAIKNSGAALSPATSTQLGGVKIGSGVNVDSAGKISVSTNYASSGHTHSGYASSTHSHSGYASSTHNHNSDYVKGNYTITKTNGIFYIS